MAFDIFKFDFTANEFSGRFEPFVTSSENFSLRVLSAIRGEEKEPLPHLETSESLIHDPDELSYILVENSFREEPSTSITAPIKRQPLPLEIKKSKKEVTSVNEQDADKDFLAVVRKEYLIREGMILQFSVISIKARYNYESFSIKWNVFAQLIFNFQRGQVQDLFLLTAHS